jgi:hypothetical protein
MRTLLFLLVFTILVFNHADAQKKKSGSKNSFTYTIVQGGWIPGTGFSRICDWAYVIDNDKVEIHYHYMDSGVVNKYSKNINREGVIDSLIYANPLKSSKNLKALMNFKFNDLQSEYMNPESPIDGLHYDFMFKKDTTDKDITVNDYYVPELENYVKLFNEFLPKEWQIWYADGDNMLSDEKNKKKE